MEYTISIADYGFYGCYDLTKVIFVSDYYYGGFLTTIGEYAFSGCSALENINILDTVAYIGDYAFADCYSLMSLTIAGYVISISSNAFNNVYNYTIYAEVDYIPSEWYFMDYSTSYSIFWACTLSYDKTYVGSITLCQENIYNGTLNAPYRIGYSFSGWTTTYGGSTVEYIMDDIEMLPNNTTLYAVWILI